MKNIVVGIDGSSCSREALRFAADEARLRGTALRVVSAWQAPASIYAMGAFSPAFDETAFAAAARTAAEEELRAALGEPDEQHHLVLRHGNPATVLLDESRDAELLVVGSRGLGGFRGLMLGSVSQQCAAHATCPVVVVHERVS